METITFTIHDRPGSAYAPSKTAELVDELRNFASISLSPLPNYQIFSNADDKIVITAHTKKINGDGSIGWELIAFTSAVIIVVPELPEAEKDVIHTGLTVIAPEYRRKGMLVQLFTRLIVHAYSSRPCNSRLWVTSLAEVPNSLVHISKFFSDVYPSPYKASPEEMHLLIARVIDREHRDKMLISPAAVFDEQSFVFKGSLGGNDGQGGAFIKNVDDPQFWHRDKVANDFYRRLLKDEGDEVLQVAHIDRARIAADLKALGMENFGKRAKGVGISNL
jgi:hypothetical protein